MTIKSRHYDREAEGITERLPPGPRCAIIGSTSFWGHDSNEICVAIGIQLATIESLALLTGGMTGVGEIVGRSFYRERRNASMPPNTYHILPRGFWSWDYGVTLFAGSDMSERREILGRLAPVYLSIEGGPGTAHEAEVAQSKGAAVIPVGRTGGFSRELYHQIPCPVSELELEWRLLHDVTVSVERLALAIKCIIESLTR